MTEAPSYCSFAALSGIRFTDAQRVLASVMVDRVDPATLSDGDRQLVRELFGAQLEAVSGIAFATLVLLLGRGSGKSTLAALYALWRALFASVKLGPGEIGIVPVIGPTLQNAQAVLQYAKGLLEQSPWADCLETETSDSILLRRPDGQRVEITAFAASRGGATARGRTILAGVIDESCFMRGENSAINDADVFGALTPRLISGGSILLISTTWIPEGLTYELFSENFGKPSGALVARGSTIVMRGDDPSISEIVARERARDPEAARRELDCQWLPGGSDYLPTDVLEGAIVEKTERKITTIAPVRIGGDIGLTKDGSAFVACQRQGDRVVVLEVLEMRPGRGMVLSLERVVIAAAEFAARHSAREIAVDGFSFAPAVDHVNRLGLPIRFVQVAGGNEAKSKRFFRVLQAFNDKRIAVPQEHAAILAQLGSLSVTPKPGGGFSFEFPRRGGHHCDAAAALVLSAAPLCEQLFTYEGLGTRQAKMRGLMLATAMAPPMGCTGWLAQTGRYRWVQGRAVEE